MAASQAHSDGARYLSDCCKLPRATLGENQAKRAVRLVDRRPLVSCDRQMPPRKAASASLAFPMRYLAITKPSARRRAGRSRRRRCLYAAEAQHDPGTAVGGIALDVGFEF